MKGRIGHRGAGSQRAGAAQRPPFRANTRASPRPLTTHAASHRPQGEEGSSSDEEDGSGSDADAPAGGAGAGGAGGDDDAKPKAASATEGLIETANPNAPRKATMKAAEVDMDAPQELSRRERCVLGGVAASAAHRVAVARGCCAACVC